MTTITFSVAGVPKPKGSMRAFVREGRPIVTSDNPGVSGWQQTIGWSAVEATRAATTSAIAGVPFPTDPVRVTLRFELPRPTTTPRRAEPTTKPDLDKLTRAVFDALTGVLWTDDAQVCWLEARKRYITAGGVPGVHVTVTDDNERREASDV